MVFTFVGAGNKCPLGENCIMNHYCPKGPKCVFRKQGKCKFVGSESPHNIYLLTTIADPHLLQSTCTTGPMRGAAETDRLSGALV